MFRLIDNNGDSSFKYLFSQLATKVRCIHMQWNINRLEQNAVVEHRITKQNQSDYKSFFCNQAKLNRHLPRVS